MSTIPRCTLTIRADLAVLHPTGEESHVLGILAPYLAGEVETDEVISQLEAEGYAAALDGAFRRMLGGNLVSDAEYLLGSAGRPS